MSEGASYHEDGRTFLNKNKKKYDVIFGDAFRSFYAVPYNLTTREAVGALSNSLTDKGIVIVNLVSALQGDKSLFLQAEYATFKKVFPQVYLAPVADKSNGQLVQNIMLIALKSHEVPTLMSVDSDMKKLLDHFIVATSFTTTVPALTDDYAPVENYIMKLAEN